VSALEDKLTQVEEGQGTRPQRLLHTLRDSRGYRVLLGTEARPERVSIQPMEKVGVWRRLPGAGGLFEKEEE
jgi:hypothetical protein